jgi:hypothetical protein
MPKVRRLPDYQKTATRLLLEFFHGDKGKVSTWWQTNNPLLGNIAPATMVRLGRGKKVLEFIQNQLAENEAPETGGTMRAQGVRHAADRLSQRFGIKLDTAAHKELIGLIRNCKWTPVRWEGDKLRVRMEFRGQKIDVVFNRSTLKLITIIPAPKPVEPKVELIQPIELVSVPDPENMTVVEPMRKTKGGEKCKTCKGKMPVGWWCSECEGDND